MHSRQQDVLADLDTLAIELQPGQNCALLASDIVDYFPQIDLVTSLEVVSMFFWGHLGDFACKLVVSLVTTLLNHKYFKV